MAIPDLLKNCPLFVELYDAEIETIVHKCQVLTFNPGDVIVKAGHEGKEIFVIIDGKIRVKKNAARDGKDYQELKKGDVIGEACLLEERVYKSEIVSYSQTSLLEIPYEIIFRNFHTEPKLFAILMLNLSRMLARRLRE